MRRYYFAEISSYQAAKVYKFFSQRAKKSKFFLDKIFEKKEKLVSS